jgi:quaternary ammonium compound-resistance protein SugE
LSWVILIIAGLFETGWVIALKFSDGMKNPLPAVIAVVLMGISVVLLSIAMKELPVGTAYAVWTGIGVMGAVIFGIVFLHEPVSIGRSVSLALVFAGIVGLQLTTTS